MNTKKYKDRDIFSNEQSLEKISNCHNTKWLKKLMKFYNQNTLIDNFSI